MTPRIPFPTLPPHPADGLCARLVADLQARGCLAPLLLLLLAPLLRLFASLDRLMGRWRSGTLPLHHSEPARPRATRLGFVQPGCTRARAARAATNHAPRLAAALRPAAAGQRPRLVCQSARLPAHMPAGREAPRPRSRDSPARI
jgi:hypothetical protein